MCAYWNRPANRDLVTLLRQRNLVSLTEKSASNSQAIAKGTLSRRSAFLRFSGEEQELGNREIW